jgi:hypothetical protein
MPEIIQGDFEHKDLACHKILQSLGSGPPTISHPVLAPTTDN